jgi:hypothetical protein
VIDYQLKGVESAEPFYRLNEAFAALQEKVNEIWNVATGEAYWSKEHFRIFGFDPQKV